MTTDTRHPLSTEAMLDRVLGYDLEEDVAHCVSHEHSMSEDTGPDNFTYEIEAVAALASLHLIRDLLGRQLNRAYDDCVENPGSRQRMRELLEMISARVQTYQKDLDLWERTLDMTLESDPRLEKYDYVLVQTFLQAEDGTCDEIAPARNYFPVDPETLHYVDVSVIDAEHHPNPHFLLKVTYLKAEPATVFGPDL